mmetsp:Transcript_11675/g.21235  ORF Transcript_11675/g.21235 Transcript_11675/m.21235 type:complete len:273 (-) Transcript_11675:767-1585(-)
MTNPWTGNIGMFQWVTVDADLTTLNVSRDSFALFQISSIHGTAQAILGIICESDGVHFTSIKGGNRHDRTKCFLCLNDHGLLQIRKDGNGKVMSRRTSLFITIIGRRNLALVQEGRTLLDRIVHLTLYQIVLQRRHERSHLCLFWVIVIDAGSNDMVLGGCDLEDFLFELGSNGFVDVNAFDAATDLSGIVEGIFHGIGSREVQVGIAKDNHGIFPTQFQYQSFERRGTFAHDLFSHGRTSRHGHHVNVGRLNQPRSHPSISLRQLQYMRRQ